MVSEPDFERMGTISIDIGNLVTDVELLEGKLTFLESKIVLECMNNPKYFKNGKAMSLSSIQALYFYAGFDGELLEDRAKLAQLRGELARSKLLYKMLDSQVGAWRTDSANQRTS